jgi:FixJ family two-component response regulator
MTGIPPRVFVVDDDAHVLAALERLLRVHGFGVEVFTSAKAFLDRPRVQEAAVLLLDLRMPGLSGLDVQQALRRSGLDMPIIFLSGESDVPSTARAMREGAVDFLVKPVAADELLAAVERAATRAADLRQQHDAARRVEALMARLTKREREVCELVARGLLNKQIAYELGTSEKTVKVHRGRVMHKLEVSSVAALVQLLSRQPVHQAHHSDDHVSDRHSAR